MNKEIGGSRVRGGSAMDEDKTWEMEITCDEKTATLLSVSAGTRCGMRGRLEADSTAGSFQAVRQTETPTGGLNHPARQAA